jgi:NAD(P)-dependent dehydrogenase (short-subunit alcohol dehydrogenase family)
MELCKGFQSKSCFHKKNPSITWISSIASLMGNKGIVSYCASKGAINAAVRALAIESSMKKIRVNAVLPGIVKTPMIEKEATIFTPEALEQLENEYPLGLGEPADIAELVCFLISNKARWISGQSIIIDGGRSLL